MTLPTLAQVEQLFAFVLRQSLANGVDIGWELYALGLASGLDVDPDVVGVVDPSDLLGDVGPLAKQIRERSRELTDSDEQRVQLIHYTAHFMRQIAEAIATLRLPIDDSAGAHPLNNSIESQHLRGLMTVRAAHIAIELDAASRKKEVPTDGSAS